MVAAVGRRDDRAVDESLVRVLEVANRGFAARLALVGAGDWTRPTPCTEWDVRALVNHVVGANVRYDLILRGAPLEQVEATRDIAHLGVDPLAAFASTATAALAGFEEPGALDRTYRHAVGERTGQQLLVMRILDVGVHTWDLARAIKSDERIDEAVVAVALRATNGDDDGEEDDTSPQDRLLLRSGRHPHEEERS